ncbi:FAD-dependent oxidoreductase [Methylobacterium sp. sgz302541]|uniref:FAD-dependent oxidoreductase n=1 Tax=unclassified Methylobacterium TaxID=2615210 RepID=UPI003D33BC28
MDYAETMTPNPRSLDSASMAATLLAEFKVADSIYILGSFAKGLTVFDQQVRAHNFAWALWRGLEAEETPPIQRKVAVIGGGVAGLTVAACLLSRSAAMDVAVFEERWDLCPLQQGSDTRWVHPHLYGWPREGSRAPDAGLPVLNWTEGRASDVSRSILDGFARYAAVARPEALRVYLGLSHLRIDAALRKLEWMGRLAQRVGNHFRAGPPQGGDQEFDVIILAAGFGLERGVSDGAPSYWRNDTVGQPSLYGGRSTYLVSGYGDGALVDLCRLTIERFRQDTVLYELFEPNLEELEQELRTRLGGDFGRSAVNARDLLTAASPRCREIMEKAECRLRSRLRKDTHVILHASGNSGVTSIGHLFAAHSSFLNRTLLWLLYRCGAFTLALGTLEEATREFQVPGRNVLARHGADTARAVKRIFSDITAVDLGSVHNQPATRRWPLGAFPPPGEPT